MIILHESCDRIVQGSRPVIAESLYHGVFFCLPLYRKKVTELSCANMCKISKNGRKHLFNSAKYSIHLKHSKHPFMQKTAVRNPEMTAILQKRRPSEKRAALSQYRFSKGAFRASGLKQPVPPSAFCAPRKTANAPPPRILRLRRKTAPKMKNRSRDPHHAPKSVADFAARRRQIILIINRRDMRVAIYSSRAAVHRRGITIPAPFRARQSCHFLETGSLHPPPAALHRFPCAWRFILLTERSVRACGACAAAERIPLKKRGRRRAGVRKTVLAK